MTHCYQYIFKYFNITVCSCHVTYAFQSESTLYICLNVREPLARSRREISSLSECNWTGTRKQLVYKRTLNHLDKLAVPVQLQSLISINFQKTQYFEFGNLETFRHKKILTKTFLKKKKKKKKKKFTERLHMTKLWEVP